MSSVNDLHVHSTLSDGRETPDELVERARRQGLSRLVITDHGRVTVPTGLGVDPLLPFPGAEVSTMHGGRRHHLLAFGPALLGDQLNAVLRETLAGRTALADAVAERVGVVRAAEDYPSRTSLTRLLAEALSRPVDDVRDDVIHAWAEAEARCGYSYAPTLDVLDALVEGGAIVCLAHPFWQIREPSGRSAVLTDLRLMAERGLWGSAVRSYHSRNWDDDAHLLRAIAELGLATIGGSDYHGNGKTALGSDPTLEATFLRLEVAVLEYSGAGR
ncbi:PHP domain-containing protein [Microbacterium sp. A8/3-1]|uniref:PHP domain-containing protein n=1 Tax=Microbacterium sp. A8/3-1 TaxID=3160749 RepID=A0AAU7VZI4_9MICO